MYRIYSIPFLGPVIWHTHYFVLQVYRYGFRGALDHRRQLRNLCNALSDEDVHIKPDREFEE